MNARTTLITPFLLGLLLLLAPGCAEDEVQVLVIGNALLEDSSNQCIIQNPNQEGPFRTRGVLDLAFSPRYIMYPTLLNQLKPSSEARQVAGGAGGAAFDGLDGALTEGNIIQINQVKVTYQVPTELQGVLASVPSEFDIPLSMTIFPESLATAGIEVVSNDIGEKLAPSIESFGVTNLRLPILINLSFSGKTTGGIEIESSEFTFPLDLCYGCLVAFSPATVTVDPDTEETVCDVTGAGGANRNTDVPCNFGQDTPISCDLCLSSDIQTIESDESTARDRICQPN